MKTIKYLFGSAAIMMLAACSQTDIVADGQGKVSFSAALSSDVEVVSRVTSEESEALANSSLIWISSEKGVVRQYKGLSEVPATIDLVTGSYTAEVWAGDSVPASFDTRCFYGAKQFEVTPGTTTHVEVNCPIANVVASVDYSQAEGLDEVLKDYKMVVGHKRGSLEFVGNDTRKGYFMMPASDPDRVLTFTFSGTQLDGSEFVYTGTIENARKATEYQLIVKYKPVVDNVGGTTFTITIDRQEITLENKATVVVAPKFIGNGFELSEPITGEQGTIGRRSVYVSSPVSIRSLILKSEALAVFPIMAGNDCDLLNMSDAVTAELAEAGINYKITSETDAETGVANTLVQVNFEEKYTNALTNGDYVFEFTATDNGGRVSSAVMTIMVSDAPALTLAPVEGTATIHSAEFRGQVCKDGIETVGFNYRKLGDAEWTYIQLDAAVAYAKDDIFTLVVNDLDAKTTYEYAAVCGGTASAVVCTVTTLNGPQLPNSGFEDWHGSKPAWLSANGESDCFWDSGNHGSSLIKDITTKETTLKHGGNSSAKLTTASLFGVIAAGNAFTGRFLGTENTTKGILGWGRPFTGEPKAMKIWVKYEPQKVTKKGDYKGDDLNVGDLDRGIVYIALLDDSKITYNGHSWPVIVRTADLANYSFKKNAANIIAYGEHVFTEATPGSGLIEVNIPIEYIRQGVTPSNILVVASSSIYGDYYCGGTNSTMYIDDVELVY